MLFETVRGLLVLNGSKMAKNFLLLILVILNTCTSFADNVVFFDDFNNNVNKWVTEKTKDYDLAVAHGYYIIDNKQPGQAQISYLRPSFLDITKDFAVEARLRWVGGDNMGFGVLFGIGQNLDHYRFEISRNGFFSIVTQQDKQLIHNSQWTRSDLISQESGFNVLRIYKSGGTVVFYINGDTVAVSENMFLFGDRLGFIAEANTHIQVDYIKVYQGRPSWVQNFPPAQQKPAGIDIYSVYVSPQEVKPGGSFMVNMEYAIHDPDNAGRELEAEITSVIYNDGKEVFSEKGNISVPEGKRHFGKKTGLKASKKTGRYELKTIVSYGGRTSEKSAEFVIK